MAAEPDWTDPCAVATWLQPQLYKIAAGQAAITVKHAEESVTFSQANYQALLSLYRNAVSECSKKTGSRTGRRRAFVAR